MGLFALNAPLDPKKESKHVMNSMIGWVIPHKCLPKFASPILKPGVQALA